MIGSAINTSSLTQTETTDYVGNVEYVNNALKRVYVGTGYIENNVYHCYLKDYLGNTRLVVTPTDNYYQWLNYYPFGMLYGDRGDQGRQQMKYGGKEFEDKHGLYLYDFEARYYDPALGGFLTMDPLAEKYYSTSPYAYCANNPMRYVDLHGDSITTKVTSMIDGKAINTSYYYGQDRTGSYGFLDGGGNRYSGNELFVDELTSALNKLRSGTNGEALVNELMNSTKNVQIVQGKNTADLKGNYIKWDPYSTTGGPDQAGDTKRPSYIGLGHEMAHIQDVWNGSIGRNTWVTVTGVDGKPVDIPNAEKYATHIENQLRSEHRIPLRTHYSPRVHSTRILRSGTNQSLFYKKRVTIGGVSIQTTPYIY
ncbi:RHS repeat-associated protein [Parabacteroides sp. PFB2-12]|uniref:M91 family zinc metallopeptidase n=1 Tax=unclassified Parabacteroides TaxID=2649774 RepID=UPI002474819E|nr:MULTISPECIES: M91 family zinc metallopeptidase [unclassified Parabacteroides]MDH6342441.1 RHS repeat-associated protein [Parabacteroides sp. PM6-13]MDH6390093.1 RHS repeat-associated protein [Parabacteroides sp. PFB2-12]